MKAASDEVLMQLTCQGNSVAFEALYDRYSKRMLYYFYKMLYQDEEMAQDFLQDLFLKIVEKPEQFDSSRKFSTWIYSVAHNMCKNEYRKQSIRKVSHTVHELETPDNNGVNPEQSVDMGHFNEQLFKALDQVSEDKKTAFILRYKEGFSIKEISAAVNCSEGTIKSRLFYTNQYLSQKLRAFAQ